MTSSNIKQLPLTAYKALLKLLPIDDVLIDLPHRLLYAHDASAYRVIPLGIVFPKTQEDIQLLCAWAIKYRIPLTFRSAGTSLSGQAIGEGLIVDCSKYWKDITFNAETKVVTVQPGIIGGHVNRYLSTHKRKIGPDPASINACMMGGILSNNASGMCCGIEHNSYHTIHSITCILSNGCIIDTTDPLAIDHLIKHAPDISQGIIAIRNQIRQSVTLTEKIRSKYRLKNTVGYCLNAFLDESDPIQIIKRLFIGSEGTLGFIAKAELHTVPTLPFASTAMLFFESIDIACKAIPHLASTHPAAMEIMDRAALRSIETQAGAPDIIARLGEDGTGILIEYQSHDMNDLQLKLNECSQILQEVQVIEEPVFSEDSTVRSQYWNIRKGMFPSIGASRAKGTGIINEDIAVPIEFLADAVKDLRTLFHQYNFQEAIIFGHAKEGNLHFVIAHAFDTDEDIRAFGDFMRDLAHIIIDKYQGSLKAEHGTGRNVAPFVAHEWEAEAYSIMQSIKKLFDPHGILNPGIIITDDPECHIKHVKPFPIVHDIIDTCIECGYCESHCPTHQYTLSPRQRIILDREIALEQNPGIRNELSAFARYSQIDSCATDGLCSLACPVSINTGQYMIEKRSAQLDEFSYKQYNAEAHSIHDRDRTLRMKLKAGHLASSIIGDNAVQSLTKYSSLLLNTPQWIPGLPQVWNGVNDAHLNKSSFVYLPSCTSRLFAKPQSESLALPDLMLYLADKAGISLTIPQDISHRCCGLAYASKGAYTASDIASTHWSQDLPHDAIILTDSFSCFSHAQKNIKIMDVLTFAEYLITSLRIKTLEGMAILHPPCSVQMNREAQKMKWIAQQLVTEVFIPESLGCCGFAGDHGFKDPDLCKHACAEMSKEIHLHSDVIGYYSLNPTCELGMKIGTGKEYVSLFYLIQKALMD